MKRKEFQLRVELRVYADTAAEALKEADNFISRAFHSTRPENFHFDWFICHGADEVSHCSCQDEELLFVIDHKDGGMGYTIEAKTLEEANQKMIKLQPDDGSCISWKEYRPSELRTKGGRILWKLSSKKSFPKEYL